MSSYANMFKSYDFIEDSDYADGSAMKPKIFIPVIVYDNTKNTIEIYKSFSITKSNVLNLKTNAKTIALAESLCDHKFIIQIGQFCSRQITKNFEGGIFDFNKDMFYPCPIDKTFEFINIYGDTFFNELTQKLLVENISSIIEQRNVLCNAYDTLLSEKEEHEKNEPLLKTRINDMTITDVILNELCSICHNEYKDINSEIVTLECGHSHCNGCISQLKVKKCPVCQEKFTRVSINVLFKQYMAIHPYMILKKKYFELEKINKKVSEVQTEKENYGKLIKNVLEQSKIHYSTVLEKINKELAAINEESENQARKNKQMDEQTAEAIINAPDMPSIEVAEADSLPELYDNIGVERGGFIDSRMGSISVSVDDPVFVPLASLSEISADGPVFVSLPDLPVIRQQVNQLIEVISSEPGISMQQINDQLDEIVNAIPVVQVDNLSGFVEPIPLESV